MAENISSIECQTFEDCSVDGIARVCYISVPWSERDSFCDCSSFNGWIGERCDVLTATVIYARVTLLLLMVVASTGAILQLKDLITQSRIIFDASRSHSNLRQVVQQAKESPKFSAMVTAFSTFLAFVLLSYTAIGPCLVNCLLSR